MEWYWHVFRVASHSARFKDLVGTDLEAETMEEKIILAAGRKDREVQEAESSASAVNRGLSQLQTTLNIAKRSLKEKTDDHARLEKQITDGMKESSAATVEDAITEAEAELKIVRAQVVMLLTGISSWSLAGRWTPKPPSSRSGSPSSVMPRTRRNVPVAIVR